WESGAHTLRRKARKKRKKASGRGGSPKKGEEAKKVEAPRLPKLAAPGGGAGAKGGRGGPSDMRLWSWVLHLGLLSAALGCGLAERPRRVRRDPRAGRPPRPAAGPATCATRAARGRRASLPPPLPPPGGAWEAVRVPRRRQQREARDAAEEPSPPSRALYFSGRGEQLRLRADLELPRDTFTLQVWLRAEGGQRSPAARAPRTALHSPCARRGARVSRRGWRAGRGLAGCLCGRRPASGAETSGRAESLALPGRRNGRAKKAALPDRREEPAELSWRTRDPR
ncbi:hypothetical protein P7K49_001599, partial [Saguinus oedipus]